MQGMIRRLRKKRGFSQAQLAEKIGKSRSTVAMWELGTNGVTVTVLYALAKALDVPITSFFEDDPQEERPAQLEVDMPKVTRMNPASVLTLQAIRTLVYLMLETLATDRDAARYDDLCKRLWVSEIETLKEKEGR